MTAKVKKIISQEYIEDLDSRLFSSENSDAIIDMDKFIISQQNLIKFIVNKISDYPTSIQEKSNFINFFIWKAFEENISEISINKLLILYEQNKTWFQKIISVDKEYIFKTLKKEMLIIRQPYLLNWVLEEILQDSKLFEDINFEIQSGLFVLFKTIIDIFDIEVNNNGSSPF